MNNLDLEYQKLLQEIILDGKEKTDRTGTGTKSIFGKQIRHKMSEGFPLLTTKKMAIKSIMTELKWFLKGDTNIKYLVNNGCNIWNGDAYKQYQRACMYELDRDELTLKEFVDKIKTDESFARVWGELGPVYGKQWRSVSKRYVIDLNNPAKGILELRYIDPNKIKKVRQINKPKTADEFMKYDFGKSEEYFIYNPKGLNNTSANSGIKIAKDAITYVTSGIMDTNRNIVLSYLHKAIKVLNQLRMIEDSLVIYRISRAPERRIFYIDVGNLPKVKAEQYLREVMGRYRNKLVYDANTGEIRDDRKYMSMLEDFWLPRREGGRGTEITTLPGGQNLGELTDVQYFQTKLYKALNVPAGRLDSATSFNLGRSSEITRDELKFTKFVGKLRKKFSDLFQDTLKTQLILKGVIAPEDWEEMKEHIQYDYLYDNHFTELKNLEMMNEKLQIIAQMDPYVGKYFSTDYIRKEVLGHTEKQMEEIDAEMAGDIKAGMVIDPLDQVAADQANMDRDQQSADLDMDMKKAQLKQAQNPAPQKPNGNK